MFIRRLSLRDCPKDKRKEKPTDMSAGSLLTTVMKKQTSKTKQV